MKTFNLFMAIGALLLLPSCSIFRGGDRQVVPAEEVANLQAPESAEENQPEEGLPITVPPSSQPTNIYITINNN